MSSIEKQESEKSVTSSFATVSTSGSTTLAQSARKESGGLIDFVKRKLSTVSSNTDRDQHQHQEVEKYLKNEKKIYEEYLAEPKLLILGSSDCGKSTLLKQMKIFHGKGFTNVEKEKALIAIRQTIIDSGIILVTQGNAVNPDIFNEFLDYIPDVADNTRNEDSIDSLHSKLTYDHETFSSYAKRVGEMWDKEEIRSLAENIPDITDSFKFYLNNMSRICDPSYSPSNEDIIRLRLATEQISESIFNVQNTNFHFYDVSGFKSHRHYWVQYFDNVTSILFVASLIAYDQVMVEDCTVNRMADSIVLFDNIANHELLSKANVILFLNKRDLFETKVKKVAIQNTFPDYNGKQFSCSAGLKFFDKKFRAQVKDANKEIITHITCCTDSSMMQVIIGSILHQVLENNMKSFGF